MAADELPSQTLLTKLTSCKVLREDGSALRFGSVLDDHESTINRVMVIFIRHFFCGNCQEYIRRIASDLPPKSLPEDLSIVVVGCGAASLIQSYVDLTRCPYPVYADPSTRIYQMLGMHRTLSLGTKSPEYIQHSLFAGVLKSVVQGVKRIGSGDVMLAGDLSVNGGEFLFTKPHPADSPSSSLPKPAWTVTWCHRMRNSRGHAEVEQLQQVMGLGDALPALPATHPHSSRRSTTHALRRSLSQRRESLMHGLARSNTAKAKTIQTSQPAAEQRISAKSFQDDSHSAAVVHIVTS